MKFAVITILILLKVTTHCNCMSCQPGWFGTHCQKQNIAQGKTAIQSSTYSDPHYGGPYNASLAVDGNTDQDVKDNSCSHTDDGSGAWWSVTLGPEIYNISQMVIYLRTDTTKYERNDGLKIYVDGLFCYGLVNTRLPKQKIRCESQLRGNSVNITIDGGLLTLCEVEVFVCSDGWFGADCDKQCQCYNASEVCDKDTGYCRSGCIAGKHGDGCQQDCNEGSYGQDCQERCGHCVDVYFCNKTNGVCENGCEPNYAIPHCQGCADGYYGESCAEECGRCLDVQECNTSNGVCESGCEANYKLPNCKDCTDGFYGDNCTKKCGQCRDNNPCNTTNGVCKNGCIKGYDGPLCQDSLSHPSCHCTSNCHLFPNTTCGPCKPNWFGKYCQKYNIARGKYTNQSSTYMENGRSYYPSLAVDGNTDTDFSKKSCTHTGTGIHGVWWYVDLGPEKYNITQVQLFLRNGNFERNANLTVYVHDHLCNRLEKTDRVTEVNITCIHVLSGNVVKVAIPTDILTLCEVRVFVCSDGWFGEDCDKQCQCSNTSEVCDKGTGYCRSGCIAGKQGEGCQQDCSNGLFGGDCKLQCHCRNKSESCNKKTGYCLSGCSAGKQGIGCQEDCADGSYGLNCSNQCGRCRHQQICNKTNGVCANKCDNGFEEPYCQKCFDGYYDDGCKPCGRCKNNQHCNKSDGVCADGCTTNFETPLCQTEQLSSTPSDSNGALAGGVSVAIILIIAAVAITVFIILRRRNRMSGAGKHTDANSSELGFRTLSESTGSGKQDTKSPKSATNKTTTSQSADSAGSRSIKEDLKAPDNVYENTSAYYNILPSPIPVVSLGRYIKDKLAGAGFDEEYKLLHYGLQREHTEGKKPENKKRNRFLELFPYDHSRVVLAPDGDAKWNYINASYISGFQESRVFIAAQGPNETTVNDLWRMIWQENTTHIVMLTRLMEMTKKKCEQYWPKEEEEKKCGNITIKVKTTKVRADFTIREFVVKHTQKPSESRLVTQLHFTSWPDHDVPSPPALVGFWKQYRYIRETGQKNVGPDVVHCSAGVGRTGTFIALDLLFDEAERKDKVNVFMCVSRMREARMNMVQTASQYRFVHESLLEAIASNGTFYTLPEFDSKFGTGTSFSRQQEQTMSREFQSLESMRPNFKDEHVSEARRPEHMKKNRNQTIVPGNKTRPFLSTAVEGRNSYINAVVIPSATQPLALIVTQTPLPETIVDFWRLVYDHDCFTIVCLDNMEDAYPKKNQSLESGPFRITWCKEDTTCDSFIKTDFTLALSARADTPQSVTVYKPKSPITNDKTSFHQLVNGVDIANIQDHKLLVHCPDGSRLSGLFCSVLNIITRVKLDKEVDVYLTLRELQCVRPQFIDSYDQYKLCYDMVKEHQRSTTVYANM